MVEFDSRYKNLNTRQKEAVDVIDGPLMVIAGPGTGKTELLSVRVANILKVTDTLAQNILCLTFTESGAAAMRERLVGLIGQEAYKVQISTFHGFGSQVISEHSHYFYEGARFKPADELTTYEILNEAFNKLPFDSPLYGKLNDKHTYLRDTQKAITELKKAGLVPDELLSIIDLNDAFIEWIQPKIEAAFSPRMSKKSYPVIEALIGGMATYTEDPNELITYQPLFEQCVVSLQTAYEQATAENSTKPMSAWKRDWCERRDDGQLTLKDDKRSTRLRAVAGIYASYLREQTKRELYDFDDMILQVIHAMEIHTDLRLDLQEAFQYVLVDEFQDTNDAQMRLLWNLTDNPVNEGRPNIMVVGDDDQAIYRFQGANISNILDFSTLYSGVKRVTLVDNYRSTKTILTAAEKTIENASERLSSRHKDIVKTLTPHSKAAAVDVTLTTYDDDAHEYFALADNLKKSVAKEPSKSRAIIARHHKELQAILPYLIEASVTVTYEHQDNILESPPVKALELMVRVTDALRGHISAKSTLTQWSGFSLDPLLPELLAHPAIGMKPRDLLALAARIREARLSWFDYILLEDDTNMTPLYVRNILNALLWCAEESFDAPLEILLDILFGSEDLPPIDGLSELKVMPFRTYYFSDIGETADIENYIVYLHALRTLRQKLREYRPDSEITIHELVRFLDLYRELGLSLQSRYSTASSDSSIQLLTAHKSKGLEFDEVYVIALNDNVWGETARSRPQLVPFPHNLASDSQGDTSDEKVRLLYVALTRAKQRLVLSSHSQSATGRALLPVGYLLSGGITEAQPGAMTVKERLSAALSDWHAPVLEAATNISGEDILKPMLKNYKLSPTHLTQYLDVTRGGPSAFLLNTLLRFPKAQSSDAVFGTIIHGVLQRAHAHFSVTETRKPIEDVTGDFEKSVRAHPLFSYELEQKIDRGTAALNQFLASRYDSFSTTQIAERGFGSEHIQVGDACITGNIDLIDINEETRTITVTDYKTGRPSLTWKGTTEAERCKLHHYRQQLLFYKVLLENSREFNKYTVTKGYIQYVEPAKNGEIISLELEYNDLEIAEFTKLINAVWREIQALHFDVQDYPLTLRGVEAFESDILAV